MEFVVHPKRGKEKVKRQWNCLQEQNKRKTGLKC